MRGSEWERKGPSPSSAPHAPWIGPLHNSFCNGFLAICKAKENVMADNRRSSLITQGVARSPNRAMLRAVGFRDGDFDKPIVGVANGHSTMNPCNAGIQPLVDRAMAALEAAGAKPQVFGVPTITDGIGMGTDAMKYSLVSREVIADCIETAVNGQAMDGVLVCGGCDKNMPGGMMAICLLYT